MFAARKMQTAAKRDDELIIRSAGQIVTRILVTGAPGFVGRALHSIEVIAVEGSYTTFIQVKASLSDAQLNC